jgi:hypothetical protein
MPHGETLFARIGVDANSLACSRRPLCRACLDWSERRHHLGGALGAAILGKLLSLGWARRGAQGRAITFSSSGVGSLRRWIE